MKYLLCCLVCFLSLDAIAQQPVTIAGEAYEYNGRKLVMAVLSAIKKPVGDEFDYLAHIPLDGQNNFNYKLPINKPRFLIIHYGNISNPVYVYPGDSLHIHFTYADKADTIKTMMFTRTSSEHWHYSGSDTGRMAFFENLQNETGRMDGEPPFKMDFKDPNFLENYKTKVKDIYQKRMAFLAASAKKYNFKEDFKTAAANEIRGEYIDDLMSVVFLSELWDKYPLGYFDEVEHENITWDKVKDSKAYNQLLYLDVMYYNRRVSKQPEDKKLAAMFDNVTRLKDDSVRNYMMTRMLSKFLDGHPANYDEIFEKFKQLCTNPAYVNGLTELYNPSFLNKVLPGYVLDASLKSNADVPVKFRDIIPTGKPVLIDFWASWCGPCIKEVPQLMALSKKYKGKIEFRFISLDVPDKESAWLKAIKDKNFSGQHYIIRDKLITDFIDLKSIPRYLVIDKDGKLNTFRGPNLLEDEKGFEDRIKAVVEE